MVIEGKMGEFYGGWGFYFVRKYLKEMQPAPADDDPFNGYEESLAGLYQPPGLAGNQFKVRRFTVEFLRLQYPGGIP